MKKIIMTLVLIMGIFVLSGCSHYASPKSSSEANTNNNFSQNITTPTESNTVQIKNFTFIPKTLTIKKGITVTWTNDDNAPHQIKSAMFDSGLIGKSQVFSFTFNEAGVFDYSCPIHPSMLGKIIVE